MVTYEGLFTFCLVIIGVISLFHNKKSRLTCEVRRLKPTTWTSRPAKGGNPSLMLMITKERYSVKKGASENETDVLF